MTLYEMTEQARTLYAMLEAGDIDEQTFADTLESIGAEEKADSYCRIIRQFQADVEALKQEKDRLDAKKKTAEAAIDRMKYALLEFVRAVGGKEQKIKTPLFSVSTRISQSVSVLDADAIPAVYKIPQPDKIAVSEINKALKSGIEIPGAQLTNNTSVIIK